ncbi:MAG: ABC transporter ATP-binding protein [Candidatus Thorarchaeota archaeon]|nr:ABC transporter ATP-binding protein [Candidatus Thorarchaeota archaeon]MCK5240123.1 ABC transporter ATP-binding protein [Candidatus Thorarchaeota archaeon]
MTSDDIMIRTKGLSKSFGTINALVNLDLEVRKGTTFGFLGPNGAGKTTTVRILSGLLRPSAGAAQVCGFDVRSQREEIKAATGLLPEAPGLYSKLSALEFLEFVGALNDLSGSQLNTRIERFLGILGLEGRQNDLLESYSSGMKQKVLVASTLIHEPKLVFLDEPTSRLDPAASALVKELILAMAKEMDTTFFICTHMIDFAEDVCETIGILNEGHLIALGSPQDIINITDARNLEDAYLKLVGGEVDREGLLSWRKE